MSGAPGIGLGRVFNVIANASGINIPLTRAEAVSFVSWEADGSTILTVEEHDSNGTNSDQALDVTFHPHKSPGVGGTWTAMAEQDDTVDLGDDTTNDALVITVMADQLSDGYDSVQCTTDGTQLMAIVHDLNEQRKPANLASNIVA